MPIVPDALDAPAISSLLRVLPDVREGRLSRVELRGTVHDVEGELAQAVLFLKPESLREDADVGKVLELVLGHLSEAGVRVGGTALIGWTDMSGGLMAAHYSVINLVSTRGEAALTAPARAAISEKFGDELAGGALILGAHELLARHDLSPAELLDSAEKAGIKKVGQGTYVSPLRVGAHRYLVLNPFHPAQLAHFTSPGSAILLLEVLFSGEWTWFRDDVLGTTSPEDSNEGSLRRRFLESREALGIDEVSRNQNCVHGSGGPIEAMSEVARFFRLQVEDTVFGRSLLQAGLTVEQVRALAENPNMADGSSLFEATECVSPAQALGIAVGMSQSSAAGS